MRLEPARVQQQHALVEHAERFQPLDLGLAELHDARIVREVGIAGVRLQHGVVLVRDLLQREDELVGGVVHAAKRRAHGEPFRVSAGIAVEERLGLLDAARRVLDHRLRHEAGDGLVAVEAAHREHHPQPGCHDRAHGRMGVVRARRSTSRVAHRRVRVVVARLDEAGHAVAQHLRGGERRRRYGRPPRPAPLRTGTCARRERTAHSLRRRDRARARRTSAGACRREPGVATMPFAETTVAALPMCARSRRFCPRRRTCRP